MISKRSPPVSLSRRLPTESAADIRRFASHTGLAMWAWNSLHASLFLIFWHLIRGGHPRMTQATAHRIWHTIQNDSTQRDMILGTVQTHPSIPPALAKRIIWLLKTADRLSTYRNIAVHSPAIFSRYLKTIPSAEQQSTRTAARLRFNEIRHDQFWRFLTGDLNALSLYAAHMAEATRVPRIGTASLPRRPRLRSLSQIDRIEGQISRLAQSVGQRPRRSSSPRTRKP
jgi:hypothetical protein